jgi:hypothetical protein
MSLCNAPTFVSLGDKPSLGEKTIGSHANELVGSEVASHPTRFDGSPLLALNDNERELSFRVHLLVSDDRISRDNVASLLTFLRTALTT